MCLTNGFLGEPLSAVEYDIEQMSVQLREGSSITLYLRNPGTQSFLTGSMYILLPGRKAVVKFLIFPFEKLTFSSNVRAGGTHKTLITKCNPRFVLINKLMKNSLKFREESREGGDQSRPGLTWSSIKCLCLSK